jgi:hypothetical protein
MDKTLPGRMVVSAAQRKALQRPGVDGGQMRGRNQTFLAPRTLEGCFNDSLSPSAPIASGHHVSNFPDRIARAIVLA